MGRVRLIAEPDGRPEILALRALKLGDLLVAVPALHAIRRAYPGHRLVLAVPGWLDPIVDLVAGVGALLPTAGLDHPLSIEHGRIDVAVNLHGRGPESDGLLDAIGARQVLGHRGRGRAGPEWVDGIHERVRWARLASAHGMPADPDEVWLEHPGNSDSDGAAVVHVGAFYGSRQWPAERFARVAAALDRVGLEVLLTGSGRERDRALEVAGQAGLPERQVLAGQSTLRQLAAVIAGARVVISADTGAAHLASAYAVPSVVLFGPAPPGEWGPPPGPHIVLTNESVRKGDTFGSEPDPALLAVSADDVLKATASLLGERLR